MKMKEIILILFFAVFVSSCAEQKLFITEINGSKISLDKKTEPLSDKNFVDFLALYKAQLDVKMNEVIGVATGNMPVHAPESLLSNFCADVYRQVASEYLSSPVDIGIVNIKGLRTSIPAGPIKVSKIFELMPFENELVLVWLKGSELSGLLQFFASIGGEGVSGLRMEINGGRAFNILIGSQAIDPDKIYVIATNDYLAEGNDGMNQLTKYVKRIDTGIKIRDMLMSFIRNQTEKGIKISSELDGRITVN